jgi:hypothetical protein
MECEVQKALPRILGVDEHGHVRNVVRDDRYDIVIETALAVMTQRQLPYGSPLLSPVCPTFEVADDVRRGIYRSALYYCGCGVWGCHRKDSVACPQGGQRIGRRADIVRDDDGHLRVQFKLFDKAAARAYMITTYGNDRSKWPYDPKQKKSRH